MSERWLPVPYREQEKFNFCGPAAIQMVLEYWNIHGYSQPQLFDTVKSYDGPTKAPGLETTPEAMAFTLNNKGEAAGYAVEAAFPTTFDSGVLRLRESIDGNVPAAAITYGFEHWVVVNGYADDPEGLYVLDPEEGDGDDTISLISNWEERFDSIDTGEYPVVGGAADS